jgi:DNA-binding NarL/FixJ family response regulator
MPVMRPRIVLADDHKMMTDCLSVKLSEHFDLSNVVANGQDLVDAVERTHPDVAVVDISMPVMNGVKAAREISRISPRTKVIILTMHNDPAYVDEAMRAGVSGFVLKRAAAGELVTAIRDVLAGKSFVTPSIAPPPGVRPRHREDFLTGRQREVLKLVAEGMSAKEIAGALAISRKTVEFHKAALMAKVGVRSTALLTRFAVDHGIVTQH